MSLSGRARILGFQATHYMRKVVHYNDTNIGSSEAASAA
jgi:hypothetical protein